MSQTSETSGNDTKPKGGGPKIDKESHEILRYISEDFIFLSGKTPEAYHKASCDRMCKESFRQYCSKHYGRVVFVGDEGKETVKDAGIVWWDWNTEERRVVRRVVMEPTEKNEQEEIDAVPDVYNRWHKLKETMVAPDYNATNEDIMILSNHLMYIAGGDAVAVGFFLNWLAWLYQHPGAKMPTAVLMYSKYGRVGKSMLHRLIAKIFGPTMVASTTGAAINKSFDDVVEHKRIVVINEMASADRKDGYEKFKNMVSEPVVTFEGKGRAAKEIMNIAHYIITTNNEDALPLMEGDGRVLVMRCLEERKDDAYYKTFGEWIDGVGPALLAGVLHNWVFPKDWDAFAPVPQTEGSRAMQLAARSELATLIDDLIEEHRTPFDKDFGVVGELCVTINANGALRGQLSRDVNRTALGKVLNARGCESKKTRVQVGSENKNLHITCWRNAAQWALATPEQRGAYLKQPNAQSLFSVQEAVDHEHP